MSNQSRLSNEMHSLSGPAGRRQLEFRANGAATVSGSVTLDPPAAIGSVADSARPGALARGWALIVGDVVAMLVAMAVLWSIDPSLGRSSGIGLLVWGLVLGVAGPLALLATGAYGWNGRKSGSHCALAAGICVWVGGLVLDTAGAYVGIGELAAMWLCLTIAWLAVRALLWPALASADRALIVGSGVVGRRVVELSQRHKEQRLQIIGYVDDQQSTVSIDVPFLGGIDRLPDLIPQLGVDRVVVAFSQRRDEETLAAVRACDRLGVPVDIVPRLFDLVGAEPHGYRLGGLPIISVASQPTGIGAKALKRAADLLGAALLLLLLSPLFAAIAIAIAVVDGRPILYRQSRAGRGAKQFSMLKFRTMRPGSDRADAETVRSEQSIDDVVAAVKSRHDADLTRTGRLLRRASLDELPQLVNVLMGHMSFVGPRPLRDFEIEALTSWQRARLDVRPGISGLWQVLGRSELDWQERVQLDYSYVRHWSLRSDLDIAARTVPAVVRGKGAQ